MFDSHLSPSYYKFEISFLEHPKYIKNQQVRKGIFPTQPKQVLRVILLDPCRTDINNKYKIATKRQ